MTLSAVAQRKARERRGRAAQRFKPSRVELLLVAEAPPGALERYFYFPEITEHDSLFRYVARSILERQPTRTNKAELLGELCDRGVFLIDLKRDPVDGTPLSDHVPDLVKRIDRLDPTKIILIKATVYDVAYARLAEAGHPVVDERVPFPASGQQRRFEEAFARALRRNP